MHKFTNESTPPQRTTLTERATSAANWTFVAYFAIWMATIVIERVAA
jgi:hypothetical protein